MNLTNCELAKHFAYMAKQYYDSDAVKYVEEIIECERAILRFVCSHENVVAYDELFCTYYLGAITVDELIGGISE